MVARQPRKRSEKLDLRLTPEAKETIYAAAAAHRSVSDFVLESVLSQAEQTLADRQRFSLDAAQWAAFLEALDRPVREHPRLESLLRNPRIFDESNPM